MRLASFVFVAALFVFSAVVSCSGVEKASVSLNDTADLCRRSCPEHAECKLQASGECRAECSGGRIFVDQKCVDRSEVNGCTGINCPENARCEPSGKECKYFCNEGFVAKDNQCLKTADACTGFTCPENAICTPTEAGTCEANCAPGFIADPQTRTTCIPFKEAEAVKIEQQHNLCNDVVCPANAVCKPKGSTCEATCVEGFVLNEAGNGCVVSPCKDIACPENMVCGAVGQSCRGQCKDGFIMDEVERKCHPSPCANVPCAENMHCYPENGNCVGKCFDGFGYNQETKTCNRLVNFCAIVTCPENAVCLEDNTRCAVTCKVGFHIQGNHCVPLPR